MSTNVGRRVTRLLLSPPWELILTPSIALLFLLALRSMLQVGNNASQLRARVLGDETIIVTDPQYGPFCLRAQFPLALQLDRPTGGGTPAGVSLHPISIGASTAKTTTVACGGKEQSVPSATPLTNAGNITYAVFISTPAGVALVDDSGRPHTGQYLFGVDFQPRQGEILYLRQTAPSVQSTQTNIGVHVGLPNGQRLTGSMTVAVALEALWSARLRYLVDGSSTLDVLAIWAALMPIILGVLITARHSRQERARQREQAEVEKAQQALADALQNLSNLRHSSTMRFVDEVLRIESAKESPWDRDEARAQLKSTLQRLAEPLLQTFINLTRLHRLHEDDQTFREHVVSAPEVHSASQALEWIYIDHPYDSKARETALQIATRLRGAIECDYLLEYVRQEHWASLLLAWPTFTFWRDRPATLNIRSICSNRPDPFAAEYAEDDPWLFPPEENTVISRGPDAPPLLWRRRPPRQRRVIYRSLQTDAPTLVIGASGSGKTAAAFFTAHYHLLRQQRNVLPVYWPLSATTTSAYGQWRSFAMSHAKTLAAHIGSTPQAFLEAHPRQQNAMARLLACCFGPRQKLENLFYQLHLRSTDTLSRLFEQLHRHTTGLTDHEAQFIFADSERLLQLVCNTYPKAVQRFFLVADVQGDNASQQHGVFVSTLASVIDRLLHLGFAVNALLPFEPGAALRSQFAQVIPYDGHEGNAFCWSHVELRQLLENRLLIIDDTKEGSLGTLVDADHATITQLTNAIIEKSDGRPGRLLAIGRRLVRKCVEVGSRISPRVVEEILQKMD